MESCREPGKRIRGFTYIHRNYEGKLPEDLGPLRSSLPEGFEYDVVKYDPSGPVTFARVDDFDAEPEPSLIKSCRVTRAGEASCREYRNNPPIYHGKWRLVGPDYAGFDTEASRRREERWKELSDVDILRIGRRDYWEREVLPRLEGKRTREEADLMRATGWKGGATASNPVVTRYAECAAYPPDVTVLDFGAGMGARQTARLRARYPGISAYDFPRTALETMVKNPDLLGTVDPLALDREYEVVLASNVLNVQPSRRSLEATLDELVGALAVGGELVANIPRAPIKLGVTQSELAEIVKGGLEERLEKGSVEVLGEVCGEKSGSKLLRVRRGPFK
jgi:hypothetical protein